MRRSVRALAIVVALAVGLLPIAGCKPNGTNPPIGPVAVQRLTIGATQEPDSLDPMASAWAGGPFVLLYNVYETLTKVDNEGKIHPYLAKEWKVSADRLTYTFTLDTAATFASGKPVRAADVVWSLERARTSKGTASTQKVVKSVTAQDDSHVVVTLSQPSNDWFYWLSSTPGMVYESGASVDWAKATAGSGPYKVNQWRQGQSIELVKNDAYWGAKPRFDSVTFRYYADATAMNNSMLAGDLDIISNVQAPQSLSQFQDTSRFSIIDGTTNGEIVLGLNNANPVLAKKEVRQAITMGIDRNALMKTVWAGHGKQIGSMVPPTDPWYEDLSKSYPFDPAKAKQMITDAGASGTKLRLRPLNYPYAVQSAQFVASQLKDIGLDVSVEPLEGGVWFDQVYQKADYDLTIVAHVEAHDLCNYARDTYYWNYSNPTVKQLCTEADKATESDQTTKLKQVGKILNEDAASVWLFLLPNLIVTKADITGVNTNLTSLSFDLSTIAARR